MSKAKGINLNVNADISQTAVLAKLVDYLKLLNRDNEIIERLDSSGYCAGFTPLVLYALWLQFTQLIRLDQQGNPIERDDWTWVKNTLEKLMHWNGKKRGLVKKKNHLQQDIERFLSLIEFFQHCYNYDKTNQMEIDHHLQDTQGRKFIREYSLGGNFIASDFTKPINLTINGNNLSTTLIQELIKDDRLVMITCETHVVGLIKHHKNYYFYDASSTKSIIKYNENETTALIEAIFKAHQFNPLQSSGLGFCIYCASDAAMPNSYPSQEILLDAALSQTTLAQTQGRFKQTALHTAVSNGCQASAQYYLKHPPIPLEKYLALTSHGKDPLHEAAYFGYANIVQDLISAGASINTRNYNQGSAIALAVRYDFEKTALLLLEKGANPDFPDKTNKTPLHWAITNNNEEMIKLLLKYGAKPNQKQKDSDGDGDTVLHDVATSGNIAICKILLQADADVNSENSQKQRPLFFALENKQLAIIKYLLMVPDIKISLDEYRMLVSLAKETPNDTELSGLILCAQTILMRETILQQLHKIKKSHPKYFAKAQKQFACMKNELDKLTEDKKMSFMLDNMLPLLKEVPKQTERQLQLWNTSNLTNPILALSKKISSLKPNRAMPANIAKAG